VVKFEYESICGTSHGRREMKASVSKNPSLATSRSRKDMFVWYAFGGGQMKRGIANRRQYAVVLEVALTVHKAQVLTCEVVGVDLGCEESAYFRGLSYTAVTRGKRTKDLYFCDVSEKGLCTVGAHETESKIGRRNEKVQESSGRLRGTAGRMVSSLARNLSLQRVAWQL
jgi:hypothetical protein